MVMQNSDRSCPADRSHHTAHSSLYFCACRPHVLAHLFRLVQPAPATVQCLELIQTCFGCTRYVRTCISNSPLLWLPLPLCEYRPLPALRSRFTALGAVDLVSPDESNLEQVKRHFGWPLWLAANMLSVHSCFSSSVAWCQQWVASLHAMLILLLHTTYNRRHCALTYCVFAHAVCIGKLIWCSNCTLHLIA